MEKILSPFLALCILFAYLGMLLLISHFTSKRARSNDFFDGGHKSPWWSVAFGMIGSILSGVTFISVPGDVYTHGMSYFVFVLGNFIGFLIIAFSLLPLYYRMKLTSIYTYIEKRIGVHAYKTSAFFFLISKIIGASFRLFIVALVLQLTIFDALGIPFWLNACLSVLLMWLYTFRGGVKTIIWTDMVQTLFLISAVTFTILTIVGSMNLSFGEVITAIAKAEHSHIFHVDNFLQDKDHFLKLFISGIFITIVMVGLDQDMMQKNLSLPSIREAKKNFISFSCAFVPINFIFLCLGVLFVLFMQKQGIEPPMNGEHVAVDKIYPFLANNHLGWGTAVFFLLGVIAAAFSSADSAMIAMTTSFMVDIYGLSNRSEKHLKRVRFIVHLLIAFLLVIILLLFYLFNDESVVRAIFKFAGYTYGPLLGLFGFTFLSKRRVKDRAVPYLCFLSVLLTVSVDQMSSTLFGGYKFGVEILLINGALTLLGLALFSQKPQPAL